MSFSYVSLGSLATATTGTVQVNVKSPFFNGTEVLVVVDLDAFVGTYKVQTSPDNSTWTDAKSELVGTASDKSITVPIADLTKYIRLNLTVRTAGSVSAMMYG